MVVWAAEPLVGKVGDCFCCCGEDRGAILPAHAQYKGQGNHGLSPGLDGKHEAQFWDVITVQVHAVGTITEICLVELNGAMS